MAHLITAVHEGSIAQEIGILEGDSLVSINGEDIIDQIDYQALSILEELDILINRNDEEILFQIEKDEDEPLGIQLAETLISKPRVCRNNCVFCFIDQMPPSLRSTLYVKDDDWRMSLMMGNYVTLTNVSDAEFERIIKRHASPLYISVHATDGETRKRMMNNKNADQIMQKLTRLKEAGIQFHCQVVLCPGYNDGDILEQTLDDLVSLYPAAQSVALVPVGMTKFREGLAKLTPFDMRSANDVLDFVRPIQRLLLREIGTRFVFPSDEFYCLSRRDIPPEEEYEGFPQIENGVGLLSLFEADVRYAYDQNPKPKGRAAKRLIACGTSVALHMERLIKMYGPDYTATEVKPIYNDFFGRSITVTGLIAGGDLVKQLQGAEAEEILICANMLRAERDLFLDNMPLEEARQALLPAKLVVIENDGEAFYNAICGLEEQ